MIKNFDWKLSSKVFLLLGLCIGCHHSFSYAQQSSALKNVEVKIDCSSVLSKVEYYCWGNNVTENRSFGADRETPPPVKHDGGCICNSSAGSFGWNCKETVYKHTLMYSKINAHICHIPTIYKNTHVI